MIVWVEQAAHAIVVLATIHRPISAFFMVFPLLNDIKPLRAQQLELPDPSLGNILPLGHRRLANTKQLSQLPLGTC
jgi:hypothetical protein